MVMLSVPETRSQRLQTIARWVSGPKWNWGLVAGYSNKNQQRCHPARRHRSCRDLCRTDRDNSPQTSAAMGVRPSHLRYTSIASRCFALVVASRTVAWRHRYSYQGMLQASHPQYRYHSGAELEVLPRARWMWSRSRCI